MVVGIGDELFHDLIALVGHFEAIIPICGWVTTQKVQFLFSCVGFMERNTFHVFA